MDTEAQPREWLLFWELSKVTAATGLRDRAALDGLRNQAISLIEGSERYGDLTPIDQQDLVSWFPTNQYRSGSTLNWVVCSETGWYQRRHRDIGH